MATILCKQVEST